MEDLKAKQVCLNNLIHNTYQIKEHRTPNFLKIDAYFRFEFIITLMVISNNNQNQEQLICN